MYTILRAAAYIFAVTLQLTAALLLINNVNTKPEAVIKNVLKSRNSITIATKDGKILDKDAIATEAENAYNSRVAFYFLFFGYILGVFGNTIEGKGLCIVLAITILTVALFIIVLKVNRKLARNKKFLEYDISNMVIPKGTVILEIDDEANDI